ncbi:MAG: sigma-70 family RNA polymerase sigma factor [Phycisphaerae bacterium]|nr:sigma-70 family RNA polymerase sigma factor [Tepidisphaeraceae bacterium]
MARQDEQLTDDDRRGDFAALLARHHTTLLGYVLSLVPSWSDAEDIVQDASAVMWRKFTEFEPGTNFLAWACQVARFHVMNHVRKRGRDKHVFAADLLDTLARESEAAAERMEAERVALRGCLEKLDDPSREMLGRAYAPEGSVNRIAEEQGRTANAVYKALNRIRGGLLKCIQRRLAAEGWS